MDKRARAYVNFVKERYDEKFGASVEINDEDKLFLCKCIGPDTISSFNEIRIITNEFFSSDEYGRGLIGYTIEIKAMGTENGPTFAILSNEGVDNKGVFYRDKDLVNVTIVGLAETVYRVSEMEDTFENTRCLYFAKVILDDVSVLCHMEQLERIILSNEYTEDDYARLSEALPNCEVLDEYEASERGFLETL